MSDALDHFWQSARQVRLSLRESGKVYGSIEAAMAHPVRDAADECLTAEMEPRQFFAEARQITLSDTEEAHLDDVILRHMREHPAVPGALAETPAGPESLASRLLMLLRPLTLLSGAMAVFVLCGAGVSAAAESSLPGDFLYTFKVYVNEGVRGALRTDPDARAEFEAERLGVRLEEVSRLQEAGRLSGDAERQVKAAVDAQMNAVTKAATELEARGRADAAALVREHAGELLRKHERLLDDLIESGGALPSEVQGLLRNTGRAGSSASHASEKAVSSSGSHSTAAASVEDMIDAATKQIERHRQQLPDLPLEARDVLDEHLKNAQRLNERARAGLGSGKTEEARAAARDVEIEIHDIEDILRQSAVDGSAITAQSVSARSESVQRITSSSGTGHGNDSSVSGVGEMLQDLGP